MVEAKPPSIEMVVLDIEFEALGAILLPDYPGTTLRGALGSAFRQRACITGFETCEGCTVMNTCPYGLTWEMPSLAVQETLPKRFRPPPKPYIVEHDTDDDRRRLKPGQSFCMKLRLLGPTRAFVPLIILALQQAASGGFGQARMRARLIRVDALGQGGDRQALFDARSGFHPDGTVPSWTLCPVPRSDEVGRLFEVRVSMKTPMEIKHRGKLLSHFDPEIVTRKMTERLDILALVYASQPPTWDFRRLAALASTIEARPENIARHDFERVSRRSTRRIHMKGLRGAVICSGVHPEVLALWRVAEQLHVGKQATFGFGLIGVEILGSTPIGA